MSEGEHRYEPKPAGPRSWFGAYGLPLLSMAAAVLAWDIAVRVLDIKPWLLPPPRTVFQELVNRAPRLGPHLLTTAYEMMAAWALAVVIGAALGLVIVTWRSMERLLYPWLLATQTVPKIAIAPLLVVWMGFGATPKIIIGFVIAFFPMIINTVIGLRAVKPEMVFLGRSMGFNRWQLFWKITCPNALPSMFGGIKIAAAFSVAGAITGEFVGSDQGLGYLLMVSNGQLNTSLNLAIVFVLVLLGVVFFGCAELVERLTIPWHVAARRSRDASAVAPTGAGF
jgi:NitT/TauT family transport system permease protein